MEHFLLHLMGPFLTPWRLIVFALVAFLLFGAMGLMPPSGPRRPPWRRP